jgi:hypothetical protein
LEDIVEFTCDGYSDFSNTSDNASITSDLWMRWILDSSNEFHIGLLSDASRDASSHTTANTGDNYANHIFNYEPLVTVPLRFIEETPKQKPQAKPCPQ